MLHARLLRAFRALMFLAVLVALCGAQKNCNDPIEIQFLTVSDWHAQLDPLFVFGLGNVGGAAQISTYWKQERALNPNTLTMTAGDDFGALPPLSSFFNEIAAVLAENLMGIEVNTFGNHNFDGGVAHLQEMIDLAHYTYVDADLANINDNLTGVPPFVIKVIAGVPIAVIGLTNPDAPSLVFPGRMGTMTLLDPAESARKAKKQAKKLGARVFVIICHMGADTIDPATGQPVGPLIDLANSLEGFDFIFGDHTNVEVNTTINGAMVIENRSKGRTYAKVKMNIRPISAEIVSKSAEFITPL